MIEGIVRRMRAELGQPTARCIATGGMADIITAETTVVEEVNPDLTLLGLRMIWERNQ
jgi:type III pantothenate kinase